MKELCIGASSRTRRKVKKSTRSKAPNLQQGLDHWASSRPAVATAKLKSCRCIPSSTHQRYKVALFAHSILQGHQRKSLQTHTPLQMHTVLADVGFGSMRLSGGSIALQPCSSSIATTMQQITIWPSLFLLKPSKCWVGFCSLSRCRRFKVCNSRRLVVPIHIT